MIPQKKQKVIMKLNDESFIDRLIALLLETGKVKVTNLGIFEIRYMKEREGYNVGNGARFIRPAYNKISFRPTVALKGALQKYGK